MAELTRCNICGADVDSRLRFCGTCGTEIRLAAPGLLLPRALAWRGHLTRLGWWETPEARFRTRLGELIETGKLPAYDSQLEPWLMFSNGAFENWKLCAMRPAEGRSGWLWQPDTAVLATRCRVVTLGLARSLKSVWYKDLRVADRDRYQAIAQILIADRLGNEIHLGMPFNGTRFIDIVGSLEPPAPAAAPPADAGLTEAVVRSVDFHEVIAMFLTEIARLGRTL